MNRMHRWPFVLAALVLAAVVVLAALQFRWIARFYETRELRERAELENAAKRVAADIDVDIMRMLGMSEMREPNAAELAERYDRWRAGASDPRILRAVYVVDPASVLR